MSRKIIIDKYQGNTHWSVHVYDSFGQEHHLGYYKLINKDVGYTQSYIDELKSEGN